MVVLVGTMRMKVLVLDSLVLKHRHPWGIAYHETGSSELAFKGGIRPEILAWASTAQISQLTVE